MQLTAREQELFDGRCGDVLGKVFREQVRVGSFFGAERFVPVSNAHFMGDPEVFGQAGIDYLQHLADADVRACIPTTRNAQCVDFDHAEDLAQSRCLMAQERQVRGLLTQLGVLPVNTCIGYQTVYQPRLNEHIAWGDTGTVIYANSVLGARTNYESGAAALAAGLTGRTPEYGFHLAAYRRGNAQVRVTAPLEDVADWGALGGLVGERCRGYENVPVFELTSAEATSDRLKHLGASLASFGSTAMFHVAGATPEAPTVEDAVRGRPLVDAFEVGPADLEEFKQRYTFDGAVDLVVFTAPQLSLLELRDIAAALRSRQVAAGVQLIVTTNAMVYAAAREQGFIADITQAGGMVLTGTCWYIMDPAAQRRQFGWQRLVTNSAKLVNIIGAHDYHPVLRRTEECVEAALSGKLEPR